MDNDLTNILKSNKVLRVWLQDHVENTLLYPNISISDVKKFIDDTANTEIKHICIPITFVGDAKKIIEEGNLPIEIVTVIGFPHGNEMTTEEKASQIVDAASFGASEVDFVINIGLFRYNPDAFVNEMRVLSETAHKNNMKVKAILETYYLSNKEINNIAHLCELSNVDFIKTSTGFAVKGMGNADRNPEIIGAEPGAIKEISRGVSQVYKKKHGIKAAGGIKTLEQVKEILKLCSDEGWNINNVRIGSSSGTSIIKEVIS